MGTWCIYSVPPIRKSPTFPIAERSQLKTSPYTKSWFTGAQKRLSQNLTWVKQDSSWTVKSPLGEDGSQTLQAQPEKKGSVEICFFQHKSPSIIHPYVFQVLKKKVFVSLLFRVELSPGLAGHLKHSLRFMKFRSPPWCQRNCCWDVTYPAETQEKDPCHRGFQGFTSNHQTT